MSPRDVFIKGSPTEYDSLVVRPTAKPVCGIVYEPNDVAAVLEIKYSGRFPEKAGKGLRQLFDGVKERHSHIECMYLTLCETETYKQQMTTKVLGSPVFTLNWWTDSNRADVRPGKHGLHEVAEFLLEALSRLPPASVENSG